MKAALVPLESTKLTEMIRNIEKDVGNDTIRQFSGILLERRRQVLMKGAVENG